MGFEAISQLILIVGLILFVIGCFLIKFGLKDGISFSDLVNAGRESWVNPSKYYKPWYLKLALFFQIYIAGIILLTLLYILFSYLY